MAKRKPIKNYEDLYEIDEDGNVYSLKNGILQPGISTTGYYVVSLYKNGNSHTKKVHRLVAETFLLNPKNLPCVNHKNEDKLCNKVDNLEWCSYEYNNNYGTKKEKISKKLSKPIAQYDKITGEYLNSFSSLTEAGKFIGKPPAHIGKCAQGIRKSAYGYFWKYIEEGK